MIYNVNPNAPTGQDDTKLIPIADGVHFTETMIKRGSDQFLEFQTGDFALCFYDADGVTPITPTGGTVQVAMSPMEGIWMAPGVGDPIITASEVIVEAEGLATYVTPVFLGAAILGRITLAGITGATFVKAQFRRFR